MLRPHLSSLLLALLFILASSTPACSCDEDPYGANPKADAQINDDPTDSGDEEPGDMDANDIDPVNDGATDSGVTDAEPTDAESMDAETTDGEASDGGSTGENCGPFSAPVRLTFNDTSCDCAPSITGDELELYFSSEDRSFGGLPEIWRVTRTSTAQAFGGAQPLVEINNSGPAASPAISRDGLSLYFHGARGDGPGLNDLYVATRPNRHSGFSAPVLLAELSSAAEEYDVNIRDDGREIIFFSNNAGAQGCGGLWRATRTSTTGAFDSPSVIAELNSNDCESGASLSSSGLVMYFHSDRAGTVTPPSLWVTARSSTVSPFGTPSVIPELNAAFQEFSPAISADNQRLYFETDQNDANCRDIWLAERVCQ